MLFAQLLLMEYDILQRCGESKVGLQAIRSPLCGSLWPQQEGWELATWEKQGFDSSLSTKNC